MIKRLASTFLHIRLVTPPKTLKKLESAFLIAPLYDLLFFRSFPGDTFPECLSTVASK